MTTVNVQLPESTVQFLREEAQARGLSSAADFLAALAAEAESNHDRIDRELMKGFNSGPARPVTDAEWNELKNRVAQRSASKRSQ